MRINLVLTAILLGEDYRVTALFLWFVKIDSQLDAVSHLKVDILFKFYAGRQR